MENIKKFFSEIQMLKRSEHLGFRLAGLTKTDSLADHALSSAQIAYVLGFLEGADPEKCAVINLFHDNHETRIGDHHKVSARYLDTKSAEKAAEEEQFSQLPEELRNKIFDLLNQKHNRNTKEGIIAQDADWLDTAVQAKIYLDQGFSGCENWIENVEEALETVSAKEMLELIRRDKDFTNCWWRGLKKMTYKKLGNDD